MMKKKLANGFLLLEFMLACCIFLLLAVIVLPRMAWSTQRHEADILTRELAADLQRLRQYAVSNGFSANDAWTLSLRKDRYVLIRQYTVYKTRMYPAGVSVPLESSRKDVSFNDKGKPQGNMEFIISTEEDPSYRRAIIVAAQTGRIRIE